MAKASPFIHQPDRVAQKASDVSAADWRYQIHVKKYDIFSRVLLRLCQSWKSLYNSLVYMIKPFIS